MSLTSRNAASFAIVVAATGLAVATLLGGCGSLFPGATPSNSAGGSTGNNGAGGMTGGGSGGAAGAAMPVMKPSSNYPQNTAGGMFPYPQGHALPHCTFPAYDTDKVAAAYTAWKAKFFDGNRVFRPENNNDTVSEGIAYGMLIGVYMNDKPLFDALWTYARTKLDGNGLMTWHWSSTTTILDQGGATDGDQDMAWALLMADKQWPTGGYLSPATTLIGNIYSHEVDSGGVLKPGDNFGGANQTNPSYFAPSYYRVFARVTNQPGWMNVLNTTYSILNKAAGTYGLVPNWVNSSGAGVASPGSDGTGPYFGYDACRTPWRIALDWCENGEPQAHDYLEKIVGFFSMKSASGGLGLIRDGYTNAGAMPTGTTSNLGGYPAGMAFIGPAGVAAMDGNHNDFAAQIYAALVFDTSTLLNSNGIFTYYHGSWGTLSLLTMSGNFWDMTQ